MDPGGEACRVRVDPGVGLQGQGGSRGGAHRVRVDPGLGSTGQRVDPGVGAGGWIQWVGSARLRTDPGVGHAGQIHMVGPRTPSKARVRLQGGSRGWGLQGSEHQGPTSF